jgi:hypothetical protein
VQVISADVPAVLLVGETATFVIAPECPPGIISETDKTTPHRAQYDPSVLPEVVHVAAIAAVVTTSLCPNAGIDLHASKTFSPHKIQISDPVDPSSVQVGDFTPVL